MKNKYLLGMNILVMENITLRAKTERVIRLTVEERMLIAVIDEKMGMDSIKDVTYPKIIFSSSKRLTQSHA